MDMAQQAIVAGGCFWCVEAVFRQLTGVSNVESGYIGGSVENPTYKQVCSGATGHAEAIRISFDPAVISYADLLDVFFATHDPTQLNRQGNDIGTNIAAPSFHWTRCKVPRPKRPSCARKRIGPPRLSPRSNPSPHGIRPKITIRTTGSAKDSAIPIAWPLSRPSWRS
jgi:hypothetical protein